MLKYRQRYISVQKLKSLLRSSTDNLVEIWLGILLFIGVPLVVGLYTDWRGFLAATIATQTIVLILFVYKGNK